MVLEIRLAGGGGQNTTSQDSQNKHSLKNPHTTQTSKQKILLDFGGGTGLLVRLLRDSGIEAFWEDKYCQNLFARGFEWESGNPRLRGLDSVFTQEKLSKQAKMPTPELATSFEVFEHLPNPLEEIESMLSCAPNLLFSTELLPSFIPKSSGQNAWWYYGFAHGQHISFYSRESLEFIAKKRGLYFYSYGDLHLFTTKKINPLAFKLVIKLAGRGLFLWVKKRLGSKTMSDHLALLG
ncbi:class I SAM-dependent methyltransferase [Helicobacter sp. MIT 99-10781]|uniref:class I SAM-dependent methyltransferase n=1 Tax=Helicobacter sp. MIT 99-10781 TaxID=1332285 RepID=UPI0021626E81|nr:class I SAM-dependent methyltransferase [Helicobacter sp. MIT 99-10781]